MPQSSGRHDFQFSDQGVRSEPFHAWGSILLPSIVVDNDNVVICMVIVMNVVVVMHVMLVDNNGWFVSDDNGVSTYHRY
jgi:hypothetical protein